MTASRLLLLAVYSCGVCAQTIEIGAGAPTEAIRQAFISAFYRNAFNQLINSSAPALGNVKKFGTTGLVQEFQDAAKTSGVRYALIKANSAVAPPVNGTFDVFQVYSNLYAYYSTLAVATVGYPNVDTAACPPVVSNSCTYILLDKNYALFSYTQPLYNGQNFSVRDPFYTKWLGAGANSGIGPANNPEQTYTSTLTSTTTTFQTFDQGAVYSITSGSLNSSAFLIRQPIYGTYVLNGSHTGVLGLPVSDEVVLPSGLRRQSFEGGAIDYDPANPVAILQPAVAGVSISGATGTVRLNLGDTLALQATAYSNNSAALPGRLFIWTTSDARVATVTSNGSAATVRAAGGGTARIVASSEGKASPAITVFVSAPCCAVGEGAPTPAIGQMFVDAVTRNQLAVRLPSASPVTRVAGGYVQQLQAADAASNAVYLIAASDQSSTAYLVAGALLVRYAQLGGPAGSLGYPVSDATAGGRQLFANGALAGNPVAVVSGAFLMKWAALGYETGAAGSPAGDPASFLTFTATAGLGQSFSKGLIESATTAPFAGKTFFLSGPILAKFVELGGIGGQLGMPLSDEYVISGRHRQDFEGGSVSYAGIENPQVTPKDRQPAVNITPSTVVAGDRVRVAVGGFANGATLRVSISGQADFTVATDTGAYAWDFPIAATAKSSTVTVSATDATTRASTTGAFTILSTADANLHLIKVAGDTQTGAPGARLPLQVRIRIVDDGGNPVAGIPVNFAGSPGVQVESPDSATNQSGEAAAWLRLPRSPGIALANAEAAHQFTTFSAQAAAYALPQFPKLTQNVSGGMGSTGAPIAGKGAMLAAVASMLRYYQTRGDLPTANGLADVSILNQFLGSACVFDARSGQICDGYLLAADDSDPVVNLWRLASFTGGNLDIAIEDARDSRVRDLVAAGNPVLLTLGLTVNGMPAGSHFAVATGVSVDGSIQIFDPNPGFGRTLLSDYQAGFATAGSAIRGDLTGAVRLVPGSSTGASFLVMASTALGVSSIGGVCSRNLELYDLAAQAGGAATRAPTLLRLRPCTATDALYQLDIAADGAFTAAFTDLGSPGVQLDLSGSGSVSYQIRREGGNWTVSPMNTAITSGSIVNAASLTPDIARGGLISLFGSGLAVAGASTTVEIGGAPTLVTLSSPFRLNVQVPQELTAGSYTIQVQTLFGSAEQIVDIAEFAPAIMITSPGQGVVTDPGGAVISASNPALRGKAVTIFATGLGRILETGSGLGLEQPIAAVLRGQSVTADFIAPAPGLPGIYVLQTTIPSATVPGSAIPFLIRQAGKDSNTIEIAVQ